MATLKTSTTFKSSIEDSTTLNSGILWEKYLKYADQQKSQHILWWLVSLLSHCLLVPFIFLLSCAFDGPTGIILATSMGLFFINVVANMSGASTRFTILAFFMSAALHAIMVAVVIL